MPRLGRQQGMTIFNTSIIYYYFIIRILLFTRRPQTVLSSIISLLHVCANYDVYTPSRYGVSRLPRNGDASGRDHAQGRRVPDGWVGGEVAAYAQGRAERCTANDVCGVRLCAGTSRARGAAERCAEQVMLMGGGANNTAQ